ncbi:MAG: DUF5615 family PIN-like protein [Chromatiales bacterium]|jgi:predicted nuclease of predicted toxin-antitoxin system|nr:DUF5615 family PIN-like protein [Chromatiales bacterium]
MRLLLDEHLAARLASNLGDLYPDSLHVSHVGLAGAADRAIWDFAASNDLILVTKDDDFHRLSVLLGPPPKVVWLRLGNCRTADVLQLLRRHVALIADFVAHPDEGFLALR